jgi:hypothetical protein
MTFDKTCPLCDKLAVERQVVYDFTITQTRPDGNVVYHLKDVELFHCTGCDETFFDKQQSEMLHLKLKIEKMRHALMKVKQSATTWDRDEGWFKIGAKAFDAACEALEDPAPEDQAFAEVRKAYT